VPFQVETAGSIPDLKQYSQEFRVESKNAGPLNWQAGVYYFNEDATGTTDNFSTAGVRTTRVTSQQKNTAWAAFGSVNYAVNEQFTVRGGLRYTKDKKDFNTLEAINTTLVGPSSVDASKDKINWDLSGTYALNKDVSVYGRVATGFRAPSIAAASTSVPITVADAETITSVEAGVKADLLNRRARASLSVYQYDVKNQQLTVVGGNSNVNKLINAAKTKGHGVEGEIEGFITNQFKVALSG
jgi:iron complex outermembrane receptor protein